LRMGCVVGFRPTTRPTTAATTDRSTQEDGWTPAAPRAVSSESTAAAQPLPNDARPRHGPCDAAAMACLLPPAAAASSIIIIIPCHAWLLLPAPDRAAQATTTTTTTTTTTMTTPDAQQQRLSLLQMPRAAAQWAVVAAAQSIPACLAPQPAAAAKILAAPGLFFLRCRRLPASSRCSSRDARPLCA
jgi:hypothetical protein